MRFSASTSPRSNSSTAIREYTPYSTGSWGSRSAVDGGRSGRDRDSRSGASRKSDRRASPADRRRIRRAARRRSPWANPAASPSRRSLTPGIGARRIFRLRSIRAASRRRSATSPAATRAPSATPPMSRLSLSTLRPGDIEILDYVIVEDGGKLINPMVVDGQIYGGFAQGVGTALYEEMNFDASGQPLASTFADYLLPGPTEVPAPRVRHMETLSPYTRIWREGTWRGRRHRPAGGDRQRSQRRLAASRSAKSSTRRRRRAACSRRLRLQSARKRRPNSRTWRGEAGQFRLRPPEGCRTRRSRCSLRTAVPSKS